MNFKKEKISPKQFMFLVIMFSLGSAVLFLPSVIANAAKQDAWISAIVGTIAGGILVLMYSQLHNLHPDKGYMECVTGVLGKWFGGLINIITLLYFFTLAVILLWDIGNFLVTQILVGTPIEVTLILFMSTVIYGVRKGIENLARTAEIFIPWVLLLTIFYLLFLIPEIEIRNTLPILEHGIKPVIHGGSLMFAFPFLELLVFLTITPNVNKKESITKVLLLGVLISGFILFITILYCIFVLGAEITSNHLFPLYTLGKIISIGGFLERIEIIIAIIWFLSIYFKLSITFYFIVVGISNVAKLKDYRQMTFPVGLLLVVMTPIMITSSLFLQTFDVEVFYPLTYIVGLVFPLIVYVVALIKKRKHKQNRQKDNLTV